MAKMNVALMAGGNSSEREVSLRSGQNVASALDPNKYNVYVVDLHGTSWSYTAPDGSKTEVDKNDFSLPLPSGRVQLDYAFIIIHGTPGEDGKLQGYLEMMNIPHSSCDCTASVLTFDKNACKLVAASTGVALAKGRFIRRGEKIDAAGIVAELGLPLFVKPNASGSSCGVTKVRDAAQMDKAIDEAFKESDSILIEEFIQGRELACGVLITKEKEYTFPITEIIPKKDFFDYEAKYTAGMSNEITPAQIDENLKLKLNDLTLKIYKACGCRGIVRIDFIVKDNVPYMVEVNAVPGMSAGGGIVPQQAAAAGIPLGELIDLAIEATK